MAGLACMLNALMKRAEGVLLIGKGREDLQGWEEMHQL